MSERDPRDPERPSPSNPDRDMPGEPRPGPPMEPWHDPGPPVRKINLPPGEPSPGVDVPNPETPRTSS